MRPQLNLAEMLNRVASSEAYRDDIEAVSSALARAWDVVVFLGRGSDEPSFWRQKIAVHYQHQRYPMRHNIFLYTEKIEVSASDVLLFPLVRCQNSHRAYIGEVMAHNATMNAYEALGEYCLSELWIVV
ncbi:hypothetical protein VMCG_03289 [Cytospora schulzeri]|uniref:Uncharacterized protein n=1 Tax=Cytospora schulzeri TaxID=448051 RepID=A0A423WXP7_9PEZI|nr:hypothetical protein VMCG_03289 [Valsa malicola]